jgi:hypothetical protein
MKQFRFFLASFLVLFVTGFTYAQAPVTVGGALMYQ